MYIYSCNLRIITLRKITLSNKIGSDDLCLCFL